MKNRYFALFCVSVVGVALVLAACSEALYAASFQTNDGSAIDPIAGRVVEEEPQPTREGYTFEGWYLTSDFLGERVIFPYALNKNTQFYAKWSLAHTVTFNSNGGSVVEAVTASVIEQAPVPVREGYVFEGWCLNEDCSDEGVAFPYSVTEDVVLYAKWSNVSDEAPAPAEEA